MVLNDNPATSDIPHEYDINLVKQVVDNTYVFTEKNLPRYKKSNRRGPISNIALPPPSNGDSKASDGASSGGRSGFGSKGKDRFVPYVKTIPSEWELQLGGCTGLYTNP